MNGTFSLRKAGILAAALAAIVALLPAGSEVADAQGTVYTVTIENLTGGQPFTPPLLVAHSTDADVFEVGEAASSQLQAIAENGNLDPMVAALEGSAAVTSVVVGDGPVMPGGSATLQIEAEAGDVLSWVSMLICTNDGFTGIDSMALPAASATVDTIAYDAGTEMNTEDFADMVPPCQALVPVSSGDAGTGMTNPDLAEGGVIAMHPGVQGGNDLTATHMWTDPVASVTITAGGAVTPPSTGSGGLVDTGAGTTAFYVIAAVIVLTMGASLRARRSV